MAKAHAMAVAYDPTTNTVLTSATVNVYNPGTVTPISATIFDKNGNTLSNPLTSDSTTGLIDFYLNVAQEVDLVVSKASFTTRTYSNVPVLDDASNELTAVLTTTGDIVYASSANTPARLAIGGANTLLHGGSIPAYSAVATADLASNAVTQNVFVQPAGDFTTSSTSFVDVTNATISITTTGGDVLLFFSGPLAIASGSAYLAFSQDGSDTSALATTAATVSTTVGMVYKFSPSAAAHTYKVRAKSSGGGLVTMAMTSAVLGSFIAVELKR